MVSPQSITYAVAIHTSLSYLAAVPEDGHGLEAGDVVWRGSEVVGEGVARKGEFEAVGAIGHLYVYVRVWDV